MILLETGTVSKVTKVMYLQECRGPSGTGRAKRSTGFRSNDLGRTPKGIQGVGLKWKGGWQEFADEIA